MFTNIMKQNKSQKSLVLPPLPSLRRVIVDAPRCRLENALLTSLQMKSHLKPNENKHPDNSTKWFDTPPGTLKEMIELLHKMEKSGRWILAPKN